MLSEISWAEKDKYYMLSHMWNLKTQNKLVSMTRKKQAHRYENKLVLTSDKRERGGER